MISTPSTSNICYMEHQGIQYPIHISAFYRALEEVKDYWLDEDCYLMADNALVLWFEYQGQYYAAQELSALRLEFLALTEQIVGEPEPF